MIFDHFFVARFTLTSGDGVFYSACAHVNLWVVPFKNLVLLLYEQFQVTPVSELVSLRVWYLSERILLMRLDKDLYASSGYCFLSLLVDQLELLVACHATAVEPVYDVPCRVEVDSYLFRDTLDCQSKHLLGVDHLQPLSMANFTILGLVFVFWTVLLFNHNWRSIQGLSLINLDLKIVIEFLKVSCRVPENIWQYILASHGVVFHNLL